MTRLRTLLTAGDATAVRFRTMVDQQMAGADFWGFENWNAALLSQITGAPKYCTFAVGKVDAFVAAEEQKIAAGQHPDVANDDYLEVGGYIGDLSLVYDWCRPQMTQAMRVRWINYANQATFNAWYRHTKNMTPQAAFIGSNLQPVNSYSPWGANNPLNNYYYSFLNATMMLGLATKGENPQADGWLGQFRTAKIGQQLLPLFNAKLAGGGSREGTGYGTALRSLFKLYYWWEASTGERLADLTPHTRASLVAMMHTMAPSLDRYATTGDQARDELGLLYDYQLDYLKVLMQLYPSDRLSGTAKSMIGQATPSAMTSQFNFYSDYLYNFNGIAAQPLTDLAVTYFGSGNGMFATRGSWAKDAAYGNFICGPNDESHAHDDQGSFTLFRGTWLAIDTNMQMTSGLAQTEHVHNLVRFHKDGTPIRQYRYNSPCRMLAVADNAIYSYASADVLPVYAQNGTGKIVRAERRFLFIKPGVFVVFDPVQTAGSGMQRIWTLNLPGAPVVSGNKVSYTSGANSLDLFKISPSTALINDVDWKTVTPLDWSEVPKAGATAHRIDVVDATGATSNFLHVLGTKGAVTGTPVASDATGQVGVQFTTNDGRTVTVRFDTAGQGGTIQIKQGTTVLLDQPLPTTVANLPLFVN